MSDEKQNKLLHPIAHGNQQTEMGGGGKAPLATDCHTVPYLPPANGEKGGGVREGKEEQRKSHKLHSHPHFDQQAGIEGDGKAPLATDR